MHFLPFPPVLPRASFGQVDCSGRAPATRRVWGGGGGRPELGAGRARQWFRLGSGVWPPRVAKTASPAPWGRVWGSLRLRVPPVWLGVVGGVASFGCGACLVELARAPPDPSLPLLSFFAWSRLSRPRPFVLGRFGGLCSVTLASYRPGLTGALPFPLTWPLVLGGARAGWGETRS